MASTSSKVTHHSCILISGAVLYFFERCYESGGRLFERIFSQMVFTLFIFEAFTGTPASHALPPHWQLQCHATPFFAMIAVVHVVQH